MHGKIPEPSLRRLCDIYQILQSTLEEGTPRISSSEIGRKLGESGHVVRKDVSCLPAFDGREDSGRSFGKLGAGYDAEALKAHIARALGFDRPVRMCVVGLGKLGSAIMEYERLLPNGFEIAAGFDSNVNKLEILKSPVSLHPSHEMEDVIRRKGIEFAVLAVPASAAREAASQLLKAGIKGILNYSPLILPRDMGGAFVLNIDVVNDLRYMVSHFTHAQGE